MSVFSNISSPMGQEEDPFKEFRLLRQRFEEDPADIVPFGSLGAARVDLSIPLILGIGAIIGVIFLIGKSRK